MLICLAAIAAPLAVNVAVTAAARADVIDDIRQWRERSALLDGAEAKKILAQQWTIYDPGTLARRDEALRRFRDLGKRLADDQAAGRSRDCSAQIYLEVKWRVLYTADFAAINRRLGDLEASFNEDDQAYAKQQSPVEGSWGACFEPMFMKVEETMLSLQKMQQENVAPKYALNLAPNVRNGTDVVALLAGLLISDIARQGIDHRSELAALTTYGAQFQFKDYWQRYLEDQVDGLIRDRDPGGTAEIRVAFLQFLNTWQDPETGYWGAWYRIGDRLYRTADLSITYHLISYLQGDVQYWPKIIETTLAIEDEPYPYGWRSNGKSNNHNNYDIVKILRYGWPHMTDDQRKRTGLKIRGMLDWALSQSLQPDGSFASDKNFFSSLSADYYFGISFFDEIGYWRAKKRFWTDAAFEGSNVRCRLIRDRLTKVGLNDPLALAAEEKLQTNCGTP